MFSALHTYLPSELHMHSAHTHTHTHTQTIRLISHVCERAYVPYIVILSERSSAYRTKQMQYIIAMHGQCIGLGRVRGYQIVRSLRPPPGWRRPQQQQQQQLDGDSEPGDNDKSVRTHVLTHQLEGVLPSFVSQQQQRQQLKQCEQPRSSSTIIEYASELWGLGLHTHTRQIICKT